MKTILVPTDFSENAENALYYAIDIARKLNAKLILLNVYKIEYANSYVPADFIIVEKKDKKKESEIRFKALVLKVKHAGKIACETLSIEGFEIDVILDTIKNKGIDLVIMGTKGESNFANSIFGSVTAKVIENASCPVIAVPQEASFKAIERITYASAYHKSDLRSLQMVVEIFRAFNAKINVLHVIDSSGSEEDEKFDMEAFKKDVGQKIKYDKLHFQTLKSDDIENALEEYMNEGNTDMLVMSTHHRNFFDKLFGKSVTKHMVYHTSIPLMAFHYNKRASIPVF